eukprot:82081-Prorocentrum_minimum.AAC.1
MCRALVGQLVPQLRMCRALICQRASQPLRLRSRPPGPFPQCLRRRLRLCHMTTATSVSPNCSGQDVRSLTTA